MHGISVVLPVHNQEDLIAKVLLGIFDNSSTFVNELIIILDGCTDNTEDVIYQLHEESWPQHIGPIILHADDVFEVKADNIGMKAASGEFIALVQDDMVITEKDWDRRIIKPFQKWEDVFAVTSRAALDTYLKQDGYLSYSETANFHNTPRNIFAIRDCVNRGPLVLRRQMAEELGWMDEAYAPLAMDDVDICARAWLQHKWVAGLYWIGYESRLEWGTTRKNGESAVIQAASECKNTRMYEQRYHDFITGSKHSENRLLE